MSQTPDPMHRMHDIGEVRVRPVPNGSDGLVAYVSCRYGGVLLNDIAIRRDADGHLFLTYPRKLGSSGRPHPLHHPIDHDTAAALEAAILGQLRMLTDGGLGRSDAGTASEAGKRRTKR